MTDETLFSLFCLFAVLVTCSACGGASAAQDGAQTSSADRETVQAQIDALGLEDTQGQELMRAWELGLTGDFASMEQPVTFRAYFAMLDALAALAASEGAGTFADTYPDARASDGEMSRYDGMVALYTLAQQLGEEYLTLDDASWDEINGLIGEKCWDDITWNPLYGDHSGDDTPWAGRWTPAPTSTPSDGSPFTAARRCSTTTPTATPCGPPSR